jgi:hypothetical protein
MGRSSTSGIPTEDGRVKIDQAPAQDTGAAVQPTQGPDRAAEVDAMLDAIVRLLARQAAREYLEQLANSDAEEITDER